MHKLIYVDRIVVELGMSVLDVNVFFLSFQQQKHTVCLETRRGTRGEGGIKVDELYASRSLRLYPQTDLFPVLLLLHGIGKSTEVKLNITILDEY